MAGSAYALILLFCRIAGVGCPIYALFGIYSLATLSGGRRPPTIGGSALSFVARSRLPGMCRLSMASSPQVSTQNEVVYLAQWAKVINFGPRWTPMPGTASTFS